MNQRETKGDREGRLRGGRGLGELRMRTTRQGENRKIRRKEKNRWKKERKTGGLTTKQISMVGVGFHLIQVVHDD